MILHRRFVLGSSIILASLLLASCANKPTYSVAKPTPVETDEQRLARLEAAGAHLPVANLYQQMAASAVSPKRESLLLKAADRLLLAGELERLATLLTQINARPWPDLWFHQQLIGAELLLAQGRAQQALDRLQQLTPNRVDLDMDSRYHRTRSDAWLLVGNRLESADELVELDLMLQDPNERLANQRRILDILVELPDTTLELLQPKPANVLGGWMELARMVKRQGANPVGLRTAFEDWRDTFFNHPALRELFDDAKPGRYADTRPASARIVGVLLPLSGRYEELGAAVRDGLLSAYFASDAFDRPELRFFDTAAGPSVVELYQQAVAAGANLILGPLRKELVAELAPQVATGPPVIALNWIHQERPIANLYLFGLAPEDEAEQVAERAWQEGRRIAVILAPQGDWGERVADAFRQRWQSLGGVVPEQQLYLPTSNDFGEPIKLVLNLDESEARRKSMQTLLGKGVGFEPSIRSDADFIFLVGQTTLMRQLRPQLQFHHASELPVYSISRVYSGRPDSTADVDLEGVVFPDLPWLLQYEGELDPLAREKLTDQFPDSAARQPRLYAMGSDLFQMIENASSLGRGVGFAIDGRSGRLRLDPTNRIRRGLAWARFEQGVPRMLPRLLTPIRPIPVSDLGASSL